MPLAWDVTETYGTDNLAMPKDAILQANEKLASAYQMDYASMVTCGSTAAIQAMLLCAQGKILLGRDAHKSAVNSVMLFRLEAEWLADVSTSGYLHAIQETRPNTVYVTYPDYYGSCVDIEAICKAVHAYNGLVLVDSAHGAHFPYSSRLPECPGCADAFCVSLHKTLPCLTQGAAVLAKRSLAATLKQKLFAIHTTSPSYLIMASCDQARAYMELHQEQIEEWIDRCLQVRRQMKDSVRFVRPESDVTRFAFSVDGYTGYELAEHYRQKGILVEMADLDYVVMITSPVAIEEIETIFTCLPPKRAEKGRAAVQPVIGKAAYPVHMSLDERLVLLPYVQAEGRISGRAVGAYPPGIASLLPGERVTEEVINYVGCLLRQGGQLFGMTEEKKIWVWERRG